MTSPFSLIVSPKAGGGRALKVLPLLIDRLQAGGCAAQSRVTRSLENAAELAHEAVEAGDIPVAVGGDGLTAQVMSAVASHGGDATAALIPAGTGNDFARALNIKTVDRAVEYLLKGETRTVDLGRVNGRLFMCIASTGIDADVVARASRARFVRGTLCYPLATLRALAAWRVAEFTLAVDGRRVEVRGYSVAVANGGSYGGGMWMAPQAVLDDGLLDVVVIGDVSKPGFLATAPKIFRGGHVGHPKVHVYRGSKIEVGVSPGASVVADGEMVGVAPMTVEAVPSALKVVAPPG